MVLDLIDMELFQYIMDLVKMQQFFGADMSSSVHVDNKKKVILIFGEGLIKGLNGTELTSEKKILNQFYRV